tara:strand:+ start:4050 stop:4673 length:624 start_codon:yes stop_codon:yes gene_type:complete
MAYNILSGTVIAAQKYIPGSLVVGNIVSGNLSTSNGADIINVPRVSNATNNSILTNVSGDANNLTCESNLKFDGTTLSVTGHLTSSLSISASVYYGDGSMLTGISSSGGTSNRLSVYSIGNADGNLNVGLNYGSVTLTAPRTWTTPNSASVGDVIRIKAPDGVSGTNSLTVEGFDIHTIDGVTNIKIESPFGAVALCYVSSGSYRIF